MKQRIVPVAIVILSCIEASSCSRERSEALSREGTQVIYEAGGVTTSSTAWMIGDACQFLQNRGLDWGKVIRIERAPDKHVYILFSTKDRAGNPNRLLWVSPGVVSSDKPG